MTKGIKQIPSPNFWKGFKKRTAVVLHVSGGDMNSMDTWFSNPKSQVSAHYGISKTGEVYQYVSEKNSAWAEGVVRKPTWKLIQKVNPNWYTISIEHGGFRTTKWTEEKKQASAELVFGICKRNHIPITRENIIGHYEIDAEKPMIKSKVDDIFKRVVALDSVPKKKIQLQIIATLMKIIALLRKLLSK